ncbi:hypothetical protein EDB84DRAFT_1442746 [Lactarius hengduanensis]|nr:hypothetical protein EDB84DRAFT_1442746 [Lactarius hengduanensis]
MPGSPFTRGGERDMSIAVYGGGRSNGSPSAEAKPDLDEATLMLALLARTTPDPWVRWCRKARPGSGDAGLEWLGMMGNGGIGGFVDNGVGGMGSEPLRREGTETGLIGEGRSCREVCAEATHGYRSILEKAVIVATREFFDSVAGKKAGHESAGWDARTPSVDLRSERELEEGRPFEDNTPKDKSEGHHRRGKNLMG